MSERLPKGVSRGPKGWRISLGPGGRLFNKRFPPGTSQATVEAELLKAKQRHPAGRLTHTICRLAADVTGYLRDYFAGRPAHDERQRHLTLWTKALAADVRRDQVTRDDVSRILQQWKASGLSADTCNKRRAALLAFYNRVNGKSGENPVRDVPKFRVSPPTARGLDYRKIEQALKAMPRCKTRARLKVMAYTGARPVQIRTLQPEDWDTKGGTLLLRGTDKGRGTKPHVVLLSKRAQQALREFDRLDAWGSFTAAPMGRMWKAVAVAAGLPADTRVYDLRHAFGSEVYRTTGDLRITKELMGHSSIAMTERYTLSAVPERQRAAIQALNTAARRRR